MYVKIGLFPEERLVGQELMISLGVVVKNHFKLSQKEDLSQSVDYGQMIQFLDTLLKGREIELVETVLYQIGEGFLNEFEKIDKIDVTVEKRVLPHGIANGAVVSLSHSFHRT